MIGITTRCCLSYKDTILKANHSLIFVRQSNFLLLLILQRYYFESESQQEDAKEWHWYRCCLSYKDTILKANHSYLCPEMVTRQAVAYPTKILFWKRITAKKSQQYVATVLLLILQRYYFESESQPIWSLMKRSHSCCLSYKDTILKANHSLLSPMVFLPIAVAYPTKILFWKRITASPPPVFLYCSCCLSYKDTILKANHSTP